MNQKNENLKKNVEPHTQCPYMKVSYTTKTCTQTNEELTEFDVKHFCENQPILCYYYRTALKQIEPSKHATVEISHTF